MCLDATQRLMSAFGPNVHLDERFVFDEQDGVIVQPVHRNDLPGGCGSPDYGAIPILSLGRNWRVISEFKLIMPTPPLVRILVIDDEPIVRLDAREILEGAGYVVTEAASADEAMPLLADGETTEAILTDINMPGSLDGLELARIVDGLIPPEIAIIISSLTRRCSWRTRSGRCYPAMSSCRNSKAVASRWRRSIPWPPCRLLIISVLKRPRRPSGRKLKRALAHLQSDISQDQAVVAEEPHDGVVVAETGAGKFQNAIMAGRHRLLADEPEAAGGFDSGPSPDDLLAAALGACTSITLRYYVEHKQLALRALPSA